MKKLGIAMMTGAMALAQEDVVIHRAPGPAEPTVRIFSRMSDEGVKGAPYSADTITETTQTLADGNRITHKSKSSFARDGQGRTRREMQVHMLGRLGQTDEPLVNVLIADPVAKVQYHLDPRSKTVLKTKMPGGGAAAWSGPRGEVFNIQLDASPVNGPVGGAVSSAVAHAGEARVVERTEMVRTVRAQVATTARDVQREELGERMFEGVSAKGTRTKLMIPAGEMGNEKPIEVVTETWFSDRLKAPVYTRHYDPRHGETITKLQNVQLGEPSAHLFEVPADYKEAAQAAPGRRVMVRDEL